MSRPEPESTVAKKVVARKQVSNSDNDRSVSSSSGLSAVEQSGGTPRSRLHTSSHHRKSGHRHHKLSQRNSPSTNSTLPHDHKKLSSEPESTAIIRPTRTPIRKDTMTNTDDLQLQIRDPKTKPHISSNHKKSNHKHHKPIISPDKNIRATEKPFQSYRAETPSSPVSRQPSKINMVLQFNVEAKEGENVHDVVPVMNVKIIPNDEDNDNPSTRRKHRGTRHKEGRNRQDDEEKDQEADISSSSSESNSQTKGDRKKKKSKRNKSKKKKRKKDKKSRKGLCKNLGQNKKNKRSKKKKKSKKSSKSKGSVEDTTKTNKSSNPSKDRKSRNKRADDDVTMDFAFTVSTEESSDGIPHANLKFNVTMPDDPGGKSRKSKKSKKKGGCCSSGKKKKRRSKKRK